MGVVDVSIVICTRDRAVSLGFTLEAVGRAAVPNGMAVEVIVVDNASVDGTRDVINSVFLKRCELRYVRENMPGKSRAYNTGIAAARGRILLFTDDDTRPAPDWIEEMCRPIVEGRAKCVQGGVSVAAHLEPAWLKGPLGGYLARVDVPVGGGCPTELVGANFAVCRSVFEVVPAFDVELGPGTRLGLGEDMLFGRQLRVAGITACFAAGGFVEHHFDEARLAPSAFLAGVAKGSRSLAYIDYHWEHRDVSWRRMQRTYHRLKHVIRASLAPRRWSGGVSEWEAAYVRRASYYDEYCGMYGSPRRYSKFGLKVESHVRD